MIRRHHLAAALLIAPLPLAAPDDPLATGFEDCPASPFTRLETELGTWHAERGQAEIDPRHARGGSQCLHLLGGEESVCELRLADGRRELFELRFWAERWTRADPFSFRVEARGRGGWWEVYDGTSEVRVGGFLTRVRAPIGGTIDRLRFSCTSPEGKGILIDDLELVEPGPMELVSCAVAQPVLPVLVGNRQNPVTRIELTTQGNLDPLIVEEVTVDLAGTTRIANLDRVEIWFDERAGDPDYRLPDEVFTDDMLFGSSDPKGEDVLVLSGQRELPPGRSILWISVTPRSDADIDGFVDAGCPRLRVVGGRELVPEPTHPPERQRMGIRLRSAGDDGSAAYRIPGLTTTPRGTLIAVYDVRWKGWGDLPGHVDVGMSRSTDGGRSWEPMRIIMDMGDEDRWRGDGIGDPAVLVDRASGDVLVAAVWSHGDRGWNGSGPGLEPEETGQLMVVRSEDDGRSWSRPRNLTRMLKRPEWSFLLQGPGRGITMGDGTLVFPAQFQLPPQERRLPCSTVIRSRDGGETWTIGAGVRTDTTESAVVELADGVLMLNARDNRGGSRSVFVSDDLGESWEEHPSSRSALAEPVCMASLLHVGRELDGRADGRLLFSNPAVPRAPRRSMTLQASADFGSTWPEERRVLLDEGRSAGYSCLTMIDAGTVGILYESSRAHLAFQRVPLAELFGEER